MSSTIQPIYALVDCNNFYVSCERVFGPELQDKPVAVLSNNDGCFVARSNEIKALGIPMGAPYFKYKKQLEALGAVVLSSNYELYRDMSKRVMEVLASFTNNLEVYSIDEAFLRLDDFVYQDIFSMGVEIRKKVMQITGIPVSVGLANTKTLAKAANELAKKSSQFAGVCSFVGLSEQARLELLSKLPVGDVWGIGRQFTKKLTALGVNTAADFINMREAYVKSLMHVGGERTYLELKNVPCLGLQKVSPRKEICVSRSFRNTVTSFSELALAIASHTSSACRGLRSQNSVASKITVFIMTNRFSKTKPFEVFSFSMCLGSASDYTPDFLSASRLALLKVFTKDRHYKKAGVVITQITPKKFRQPDLFSKNFVEKDKLNSVVDLVTEKYGKKSLFYAVCS